MAKILTVAIAQLPSIHPQEIQQLELQGIKTNLDLLKKASNPQKKQQLAIQMGVNLKLIGKWVALCNLACVPSVGSTYCGLLLHAGIPSVKHLSNMFAQKLHHQVMRLQVSYFKTKDLCPSIFLVESWIKEAKNIIKQK